MTDKFDDFWKNQTWPFAPLIGGPWRNLDRKLTEKLHAHLQEHEKLRKIEIRFAKGAEA